MQVKDELPLTRVREDKALVNILSPHYIGRPWIHDGTSSEHSIGVKSDNLLTQQIATCTWYIKKYGHKNNI